MYTLNGDRPYIIQSCIVSPKWWSGKWEYSSPTAAVTITKKAL